MLPKKHNFVKIYSLKPGGPPECQLFESIQLGIFVPAMGIFLCYSIEHDPNLSGVKAGFDAVFKNTFILSFGAKTSPSSQGCFFGGATIKYDNKIVILV
jgi:hypothetical protein